MSYWKLIVFVVAAVVAVQFFAGAGAYKVATKVAAERAAVIEALDK